MIEQVFRMVQNNTHMIEEVIADGNVNYNHMILNKNEGIPKHLSIGLDEQETHEYPVGTVLKISKGIKMNV